MRVFIIFYAVIRDERLPSCSIVHTPEASDYRHVEERKEKKERVIMHQKPNLLYDMTWGGLRDLAILVMQMESADVQFLICVCSPRFTWGCHWGRAAPKTAQRLRRFDASRVRFYSARA